MEKYKVKKRWRDIKFKKDAYMEIYSLKKIERYKAK